MKTKSTLFVAACSMLAAVPVLAQPSAADADENGYYNGIERTTVSQITEDEGFAINLDGVADEDVWSRTQALECTKTLANWNTTPVENTWGYACTFKLLYDARTLYVFFDITDNTPNYYVEGYGATNMDNCEIFFYGDPETRALASETALSDRSMLSQIRIVHNAPKANYVTGGGLALSTVADNVVSGLYYGTAATEKGWAGEVAIPLDIIVTADFQDNVKEGGTILFDIQPANVTTSDAAAPRDIILAWSANDYDAWRNNARLGEITFGPMASSGIKAVEAAVDYTFAQGVLSMDVENGTPVSVLDLSGRTVANYVYDSAIDLSSLASGIYMVKAENAAAFKIVK